jgi:Lrp/AsnC family transcriptional regulator, leucine-responsive regulatory protein
MQVHRLQNAAYPEFGAREVIMAGIAGSGTSLISNRDRRLLALLRQNARRTISEMAAVLGVSRTTVKERMERLVSNGVIKQFTIRTADPALGRAAGMRDFFHVQLNRPVCPVVYGFLEGWPELVGCWSVSGKIDMIVLVDCAGHEEIERLRDKLARHPEVRRLRTSLALRQWRWQDEPELPERAAM